MAEGVTQELVQTLAVHTPQIPGEAKWGSGYRIEEECKMYYLTFKDQKPNHVEHVEM